MCGWAGMGVQVGGDGCAGRVYEGEGAVRVGIDVRVCVWGWMCGCVRCAWCVRCAYII